MMRTLLMLCFCVAGAFAFRNIDDKITQEYGKLAIMSDCFGERAFRHYLKKVKEAVETCRNRAFEPPLTPLSDPEPKNQKEDIMFDREHVHELSIRMRMAVSNSSCVQQQLGYIDDSYNIQYQNIRHDIKEVGHFDKRLMEDLLKVITECQDFTTCIPLDKIQYPMRAPEMKYLNFSICLNQGTIGACLKKIFRNRQPDDDYIGSQNFLGSSSADEMISLMWKEKTTGLF